MSSSESDEEISSEIKTIEAEDDVDVTFESLVSSTGMRQPALTC